MRKQRVSENLRIDVEPEKCNSLANATRRQAKDASARAESRETDSPGNPESKGESMSFDPVTLHWIWKETTRRLESFADYVRENKAVAEAADFARWLQFSGILKLLGSFPQPPPLTVDAAAMGKQITDLIYECGERFRNGKASPNYAPSDIAEINRKLDIIAAHVSTLSPPTTVNTADAGNAAGPALRVIDGGRAP